MVATARGYGSVVTYWLQVCPLDESAGGEQTARHGLENSSGGASCIA